MATHTLPQTASQRSLRRRPARLHTLRRAVSLGLRAADGEDLIEPADERERVYYEASESVEDAILDLPPDLQEVAERVRLAARRARKTGAAWKPHYRLYCIEQARRLWSTTPRFGRDLLKEVR